MNDISPIRTAETAATTPENTATPVPTTPYLALVDATLSTDDALMAWRTGNLTTSDFVRSLLTMQAAALDLIKSSADSATDGDLALYLLDATSGKLEVAA